MKYTFKEKNNKSIYGNYFNKYSSKNNIYNFFVNKFIDELKKLLSLIEYKNLLDVGCGEGYITNEIFLEKNVKLWH